MDTRFVTKEGTVILPPKIYQMAFQIISQLAFQCGVKNDKRESIEKILATLEECLFLNMGRILVPNASNNLLYIRYCHGISNQMKLVSYDINQGITGLIFSSKQAIYADDLDTNNMYLGKLCESSNLPYSSPAISGVPICDSRNDVIGVLCVNHGYREKEELLRVFDILENTAKLLVPILSRDDSCIDNKNSVIDFQTA